MLLSFKVGFDQIYKKHEFYKRRQGRARTLIFIYFIFYKLLVIRTKFQDRISLHSAFVKSGHFQWDYWEEFVGWSTLRPPSTVNFKDMVTYHISTDRALSGESCIAIRQNQPFAINKYGVYTKSLRFKFLIFVERPTKKWYKNRWRLAV